MKSIFSKVLAEILQYLPDISAEKSYQMVTSIYKAGSVSELVAILLPLLTSLEEKEKHTVEKYGRVSDLVKQYVYVHYQEDLSLKSIAATVFLSPQYLSSIFKKETGEGLTKFIRDYRMKKAKELLQKTNKKIHTICFEVGYSNDSYFCKSFREYFGVSPEQFRLQNISDGNRGGLE